MVGKDRAVPIHLNFDYFSISFVYVCMYLLSNIIVLSFCVYAILLIMLHCVVSVPGRPTSLDDSRARAYCACSRCGVGVCLDIFSLIYLFSFLSPSLWETARYRLKYCLKGPLNPKQPTNQPIVWFHRIIFGIIYMYFVS